MMIFFNKTFTKMFKVKKTIKTLLVETYKIIPEFKTWILINQKRSRLETVFKWWVETEKAREWGWFDAEKREVERRMMMFSAPECIRERW